MKLISLNTWGGRVGADKLNAFFKAHQDTDIFCLQEIWNGGEQMSNRTGAGQSFRNSDTQLLKKIALALPGYQYFFRPQFMDFYGLTFFVKKSLAVIAEGEQFVYKERGFINPNELADHSRNLQYIKINTEFGERVIIHVHALWHPGGKSDNPERLEQSQNIINFLKTLKSPFVLCGDFNLSPETESVKILENFGLKNLITENNIKSTRTSFYTKPNKFADYTFVSSGIKVNDFKILPEEVSDHCAMYLRFE